MVLRRRTVTVPRYRTVRTGSSTVCLLEPAGGIRFRRTSSSGSITMSLIVTLVIRGPRRRLGLLHYLFNGLRRPSVIRALVALPRARLGRCFAGCILSSSRWVPLWRWGKLFVGHGVVITYKNTITASAVTTRRVGRLYRGRGVPIRLVRYQIGRVRACVSNIRLVYAATGISHDFNSVPLIRNVPFVSNVNVRTLRGGVLAVLRK